MSYQGRLDKTRTLILFSFEKEDITWVILTTTLALMTITLLRGPVPISERYFS